MEEARNPSEGAAGATAGGEPAAELDEARRRLDLLQEAARVFAHDFKNPLSALLLGLQRLARFAGPDHHAQARGLAARLESTVQTMNRLVEGLADLARHQAGELQLEPARQPAAEIVTRAIAPLRPGAAERRQQLALELPPDLPEVAWDAERVIRALQHLLTRALHAAPEGSTVLCTVALAAGQVTITVEGPAPRPVPGLEPILALHEQSGPRRPRDLGVLVARSLAEAHGGTLAAEEILGRAPVFRLHLPLSAPPSR